MFSSDEPCAIATMLMPPSASAEKTRAATPGVPCMPRPTTANVARFDSTSMSSISRRSISSANAARRLSRAVSALADGTVKQMECSDDACEMSDTDTPARSSAENVRPAMPGTPSMPLPDTVTSACSVTADNALTGYFVSVRRPEISVPVAEGSENGRMKSGVDRLTSGVSARGWSTLAP